MNPRGLESLVLLAVVALPALIWTALGLLLWRGARRVPRLPEVAPEAPAGGWPRVSIVVPARNEERAVEPALRALLALDYPALEVVAVDDRSTDGTGGVIDRLATEDSRLLARHVTTLPAGWLGKNNAMAVGADGAHGEWLLFTDADVLFAPDTLRRVVALADRHGLGHVVAFPHLVAPGLLERAFVATFGLFANLVFRVWELKHPGTRAFVGVGAFNLVRREAYEAIGGHRPLAFEVVDDAKLGLILRRSGVPQGGVDSGGLVKVRWQPGFLASLAGLNKNAFAALEWSLPRTLGFALALPVFTTAPLVILILAAPLAVKVVAGWAALAPMLMVGALARRAIGGSGVEGAALPLCGLLLSGVSLRSAVTALWQGGIVWRDTFYPLGDLRRGCVHEGDWPRSGAVGWPVP